MGQLPSASRTSRTTTPTRTRSHGLPLSTSKGGGLKECENTEYDEAADEKEFVRSSE
ncbi:hypothetical protein M413DRAFT_449960 [Hebeloma cylindrosporum]|uniref:Uncharacterized protein n=1 Tax=Hebeloma cylindrosporum TaxID=76867 RepID=A0A0C3BDU3_HEBCY|nr:hypothetical protein M413DRAFT_449960 [Hebeloma cylindrosporum h7]